MARVTLIIPALNESASLPLLAPRIPAAIGQVLVVDNGSTDGTAAVAKALGFQVITAPARGYGAAAWAGVQAADGAVLAFASADGSDPVEQFSRLLNPILNDSADFALATRMADETGADNLRWTQHFGVGLATRLLAWRWGASFRDLGGMRAIRADTLAAYDMADRGFGWTFEMQIQAARFDTPWAEIALPYAPRQGGRQKISGTWRGTMRVALALLWTFARLAPKRSRQ